MLSIPCPWCGPRDQTEFSYGGDASAKRPDTASGQVSDEDWHDYVYLRDNRRGFHDEFWQHTAGCRRWIKVRRHTLTNEIAASSDPRDEPAEARK